MAKKIKNKRPHKRPRKGAGPAKPKPRIGSHRNARRGTAPKPTKSKIKIGRRRHPKHLRTKTVGFALYPADRALLDECCKKRGISKSSAFRLALRMWKAGGMKMDEQSLLDKSRGNRDPIIVQREQNAAAKVKADASAKTAKSKAQKGSRSAQARRDTKNQRLREKRAAAKGATTTGNPAAMFPNASPPDPNEGIS